MLNHGVLRTILDHVVALLIPTEPKTFIGLKIRLITMGKEVVCRKAHDHMEARSARMYVRMGSMEVQGRQIFPRANMEAQGPQLFPRANMDLWTIFLQHRDLVDPQQIPTLIQMARSHH
jgi:hypothetical protein